MDFSRITVLCVGDVMLDRFVYGEMERISPEAPVPVLLLKERREMPGGAGNVASNIISLGGRAILIGLVGEDEAALTLRDALRLRTGVSEMLVATPKRPTICKTRFIASHQQVVRADEESRLKLQPEEAELLCRAIDARLDEASVVILSDYGKGVCDSMVVRHLIGEARLRGIPVFVDPKTSDFRHYRGATCITPNAKELVAASGISGTDDASVERAARKVMAEAEADAILATRSEKGMMLIPAEGEAEAVPARAREVFDVSGAGDTVIATMALAVGSGMRFAQAMRVANAAAGVVVGKLGTATADIAEVKRELHAEDAPVTSPHLLTLNDAQRQVAGWKSQGLSVGFTNGCFDILHPGHISLLAAARAECDRLIVALNDDASIRRLKGETRPVNMLESRAAVMAAVRYVDAVVAFTEDTPLETILALMPDVLVKGSDYRPEDVIGGREVTASGGRLFLADLQAGHSTTGTIGRIQHRA
ncbi:bifunctional D-glycero-beta-D-manno-heptose-7-phosphate kinase/D-glycero-beta-D-manno-heptose 1-phosphate adenylyltransferase HldE [Acetobacter conturbans]|uniref:Bifunctional protein HldE n=1 Tax=Acetobacter conturbans TaxID=1737472 RepID=A0ABX0JZ31_9PROT|nr:bifunctional D-glycero-beta-D-manno-heptose-7-phosphate kinase/D-glycero-beta-D-manno-heptose 1-phosphate adenylyltransferase HldE [Acetobacter conturbans]NHN87718.1 bifunctional D-glycero-beta-D-manno-heptose-7-phosphate kinase/D-glycero-beta-D-manno-heptose 1-phosphate adenylyltransferase HldE [Acetobacter conturbans]